jgi:hypothetical protein
MNRMQETELKDARLKTNIKKSKGEKGIKKGKKVRKVVMKQNINFE